MPLERVEHDGTRVRVEAGPRDAARRAARQRHAERRARDFRGRPPQRLRVGEGLDQHSMALGLAREALDRAALAPVALQSRGVLAVALAPERARGRRRQRPRAAPAAAQRPRHAVPIQVALAHGLAVLVRVRRLALVERRAARRRHRRRQHDVRRRDGFSEGHVQGRRRRRRRARREAHAQFGPRRRRGRLLVGRGDGLRRRDGAPLGRRLVAPALSDHGRGRAHLRGVELRERLRGFSGARQPPRRQHHHGAAR